MAPVFRCDPIARVALAACGFRATGDGLPSSNLLQNKLHAYRCVDMERTLAVFILGGVALLATPAASAQSEAVAVSSPVATNPVIRSGAPSANLPALPPQPAGKSTIMGGAIQDVDSLRDQFSLNAFGQKKIRIFYDERTHVYRDGKPVPLLQLASSNHASVQTVLDGTKVFAHFSL